METLTVDLGDRSYPIYIGEQLLTQTQLLAPHIKGQQVMVVSNNTIAPLYLERLTAALSSYQVDTVVLPDGEKYKDLPHLNLIFDALLKHRHDRTTTLIALGGGVVGDMTGFAAASYQRGVNFIQLPTTLLSQVDSSVGGKTGVNHALGKNMIGAFHQPQCVVIDTSTLATLPKRELSAGLAEVIKYGLIWDREFFVWLEAEIESIAGLKAEALNRAIYRSCQIKAEIVARDEKESSIRALLNLGHTFGHGIENCQGYGEILHGEAVAIGTYMAADLSKRMGWIGPQECDRIAEIYQRVDLPIWPPEDLTAGSLQQAMALDKKVIGKQLRLVLLKALGRAIVSADFEQDLLQQTLAAGRSLCR